MHRVILGITFLLGLIASPAEARQHHRHQHAMSRVATSYAVDPGCNVIFPCEGVSVSPRGLRVVKAMGGFGSALQRYTPQVTHTAVKSTPRQHSALENVAPAFSYGGSFGQPSRYIAGRLICAVNVGVALAERGIKGTGSALALSYLQWGRSAGGPVPGAVIVSARRGGGHVAIVSRVENGVVRC